MRDGDEARALAAFPIEALRLEVDAVDALLELGLALRAQDRLEESEVVLRTALDNNARMPDAHALRGTVALAALGDVLARSGQVDELREDLSLSLSIRLVLDLPVVQSYLADRHQSIPMRPDEDL